MAPSFLRSDRCWPPPSQAPDDGFTHVEVLHLRGRIERWIRFGRPIEKRALDRRRKRVTFAPGAVFALVRWSSNDFGTLVSRIYVVRATATGQAFTTIPDVAPGGDVLLRLSGWPKVQRALAAIDAVESLGFRAEAIAPDHWQQVGNRLAAGRDPEPYRRERHRAWVLRQELER